LLSLRTNLALSGQLTRDRLHSNMETYRRSDDLVNATLLLRNSSPFFLSLFPHFLISTKCPTLPQKNEEPKLLNDKLDYSQRVRLVWRRLQELQREKVESSLIVRRTPPRASQSTVESLHISYLASVGIAPRTAASNPPAPTSLADINNEDDPAEIDLASLNGAKGLQQQLAQMGGGFPGMMGQENAGADGGDMFSQMLAQMQAGGGPGGGQNPFAAMGGMGGGLGQPGANNPFAGQQPPVSPFPPQPKTFLDKIFPLIHLVAMVGLAVYAVVWWEPSRRFGLYGASETSGIDWSAWGALASKRPKDAGIVGQMVGMQLAEIVSLLFGKRSLNLRS